MPTFPHERLREGQRATSPLPWTGATFHDATPVAAAQGASSYDYQRSKGASGEPLVAMPGHAGSFLLSPMQIGSPTRHLEQHDAPPRTADADHEERTGVVTDVSLHDVGNWVLATPLASSNAAQPARDDEGPAGERHGQRARRAAYRSSADILFSYASSAPDAAGLLMSPPGEKAAVPNAAAAMGSTAATSSTPPRASRNLPSSAAATWERRSEGFRVSQPPAVAARTKPTAASTTGLNDPSLREALQDAIFDRQIVEQLLILCDESSSRETLGLQCALERRSFALALAVRDHYLRTEALQRDILDEMMLSYTTGDHVAAVTRALGERIDIAKSELQEVEEAVRAVATRTDDETAAAEDELVRVLSAIREERQQLMAQVRWAEEQRAATFEREKDALISKNYHHIPSLSDTGDKSNHTRSRATPVELTSPWFAERRSVLLGSSPQTRRVAPRDLWVSKTLPSVQREMDPSLVIGNQSDAVRTIESVFPLPPIPDDLELIQKTVTPPPHVSSRVSSSASFAAAATGARVHASSSTNISNSSTTTFRRSVAENQQMAAAYYRSFLAVSGSSGGKGITPSEKSAAPPSGAPPPPADRGASSPQLSYMATVSSSSTSSVYPSSGVVVANLAKSLLESSAALPRPGSEGQR